jgi:hypothetical protein
VALTQQWFVVETPEEVAVASLLPDVGVANGGQAAPEGASSGTLSAAPLRLATVVPRRMPQYAVEIRDTAERQLVTAIELLSPTNKRGDGRRQYLKKREHLLLSAVHLLEIDLLRQGRRVPMREPLPEASYFVLLNRVNRRLVSEVWPIRLDQPLPTVPVPLLDDDPDVPLDLQAALTNVYDFGSYERAVDYTRPPEVALSPAEEAWAVERLRAAGRGS